MAEGGGDSDTFAINVRLGNKDPQLITVNRNWTAKELKEHVVEELNVESGAVDLIFAGRDIADTAKIENVLGEHTFVSAVKATGMVPNYPSIDVEEKFVATANESLLAASGNPDTKDSRQCYYVYCRRTCKKVQSAKLRVRCATCKLGTMVPYRDPECWDDVMTPQKISGECKAANCKGSHAEFFFKCSGHQTEENESLPPLRNVVTNTREIPCIVCFENDRPELYVFECPDRHVMCLECLKVLCTTYIRDRRFQETPDHGYSLPCQADKEACRSAFITDVNTFKIVGDELYEKYQKYGTQEYVLQEGGVLCPAPTCAYGIISPKEQRRVECPDCKGLAEQQDYKYFHAKKLTTLVFCRTCKETYHGGDCDTHRREKAKQIANDPTVPPEQAEKARLECETYRAIDALSKKCPKCKAKIHRPSGCNHMTCTCGFEFCWLCLVKWSISCRLKHWVQALC